MVRAWCLAVVCSTILLVVAGPLRPVAAADPPVPACESQPTAELVLDVPVTVEPMGAATLVVKRVTLQPSPHPLTVLPIDGPLFIVAESGTLIATEAGVEHSLVAGEPFSPTGSDHAVELRASGAELAVALVVYLNGSTDYEFPRDPLVHSLQLIISTQLLSARLQSGTLPWGSWRLSLERLRLPAGSSLPPQLASPLVWIGVADGTLGVSLDGEDLPDGWVAGQEQVFWPGKRLPVFTQPVPNPLVAPGTKMLLRNAGGRPLVLYRLRLDFSKDAGFIPGDPIGGRGSCSAAQD